MRSLVAHLLLLVSSLGKGFGINISDIGAACVEGYSNSTLMRGVGMRLRFSTRFSNYEVT